MENIVVENSAECETSVAAVTVEGDSDATLSGCCFVGCGGIGLKILGQSTPRIFKCEIQRATYGVIFTGSSTPDMEDCDVHNCGTAC
eukprot:869726-Rhodomonas_salina.1